MRLFKALIISLVIYALLVWLVVVQYNKLEKLPIPANNHVIKIDIKNIPIPAPKPAPVVKSQPVVKPIIPKTPKVVKKEPVKKKKIVKKDPVKKIAPKKKVVIKKTPSEKKVSVPKKVVKEEKVVEKSEALKQFESEMVYIPEPMIVPQQTESVQSNSNDLSSFLAEPAAPVSPWSYPNDKVRKLYGKEFHNFTPTQKDFIKDNLDEIQQITQRTLTRRGYPEGAGETGQQGTNVVSFNLHPNGDISNLRLKTRIGYRALDDNTLSLIRVAYMDYPYPTTTTKIVFYVTYTLYGY